MRGITGCVLVACKLGPLSLWGELETEDSEEGGRSRCVAGHLRRPYAGGRWPL